MKSVLNTPSAAPAVGPYSIAVEANGLVFLSGQLGFDPSTGELVADDAAGQARQALENIAAVLGDVGLSMSDVVKTSVFLADIDDYGAVNYVYAEFFGDEPPARSAFQVAHLPRSAKVEIELIAAR